MISGISLILGLGTRMCSLVAPKPSVTKAGDWTMSDPESEKLYTRQVGDEIDFRMNATVASISSSSTGKKHRGALKPEHLEPFPA